MKAQRLIVQIVILLGLGCVEGQTLYSPDKDGFIRDWLVAGPFPSEPLDSGPSGFNMDFLAPIGGEQAATPFAGLVLKDIIFKADVGKLVAQVGATNAWGYTKDKKIDVTWKPLHWKEASPVIKLNDLHPDFKDYYVVYLAAYVFCPEEKDRNRRVQVRLGSDDDFRLWINGKLIGEKSGSRPAHADDDAFNARLEKGWNRILFKICDRTMDAAAVLRLTDVKGKPMESLKVALELPEHRFRSLCKNIGRVDTVMGGLFARIDLGEPPVLVGSGELDFRLGYERQIPAEISLSLKQPDGKSLSMYTGRVSLDLQQAWLFKKPIEFTQSGSYVLTCEVKDLRGKILGSIEKSFQVIGFKQLLDEQKTLARRVELREKELKENSAALSKLESILSARNKVIAEQYKEMEQGYSRTRKAWIEKYGPAAFPAKVPFEPAADTRRTLCMNGDLWEIAPAKSTGKRTVDDNFIPVTGWEKVTVPVFGVDYYYRSNYWPMKDSDALVYAPAKEALDLERAGDFRLNEGRENKAMFLRTSFNVSPEWMRRRVLLTCEMAHYKVKVWVNGQFVGEHYGWAQPLEMDLTKFVKEGTNTLLVYAGREWIYIEPWPGGLLGPDVRWGLMSDVYLKSVPDVFVSDVWVIPNWRMAKLEVRSRIRNTSNKPRKITLNHKVILDGKVGWESGSKEIEIAPGAEVETVIEKPWANPKLWDVGTPVLYQLASTLVENNQTLDQHFQRFGFREIWMSKYDFWMNGKRLFIQGDVLIKPAAETRQLFTLFFSLLRNTGNINAIRSHFDMYQGLIADVCDELGMLFIPQTYPQIDPSDHPETGFIHKENLRRYRGWVRWLRNHPSVVVYSTDNEIFTQASKKPWDKKIRADRFAAQYERYVQELDPTRLVTRSGDQGTWGKMGAWQPDIPSRIANYHYPEFNPGECLLNWQSTYDKPLLIGETLYCAYGAWNGNIGAIPSQVQKRAQDIRETVKLYRDLEIPGWAAMGLGHDGFIELKENGTPFAMMPKDMKGKWFPGCRLIWPAQSGPGLKWEFGNRPNKRYGFKNINWYVPGYPVCVLNAVNQAYKETTRPMPPVPAIRSPEIIFHILRQKTSVSGALVYLTPLAGQGTECLGVRADREGKAWFVLKEPGKYRLTVDGTSFSRDIEIKNLPNEIKAGLDYLPIIPIVLNK